MPKLWNETIEAHKRAVVDAILASAWRLVTEHGLTAVTMSQVAKDAGIGRATLYKYFPDVEAILFAWHQRQVGDHLAHLTELSARPGDVGRRLEAVLEAYAVISYHREHGSIELDALFHRGAHVVGAQQQVVALIRNLVADSAEHGQLRRDVSPDELAMYCLHALGAAGSLRSEAAVRRLVKVTLAGLRSPDAAQPRATAGDVTSATSADSSRISSAGAS